MRILLRTAGALALLGMCWALTGNSIELRRPQGPGAVPEGLHEQYEEMLADLLASIPKEESKAVRAEVTRIYTDRTESFLEDLDHGGFLFDHPLNDLVNGVMATMLEQWPALQGRVRTFVARDAVPNAYSVGEGTIVVNLGLLERMETEAQLAFVLGHELAHYGLDHSDTDLWNYARAIHDKEFAKKLKSISRSSYNRVEKLSDLLLGFALDKTRHGRMHEFEADSVGFDLLSRSPYQRSAGATSMDVLLACDHEPWSHDLDYHQAFLPAGAAFDPEHIRSARQSSLGTVEQRVTEMDDSLRTHPDCTMRKERLLELLEAMGGDMGTASLKGGGTMEAVRSMATMEIMDRHLFAKQPRPAPAMYRALRMLESRPDDAYCHAAVGIALATLHHYQSKRLVGTVLTKPHFTYSESYRKLLHFLADVRLKDLSGIGYAWMASYREHDTDDAELLVALALTSHSAGHSEEAAQYAAKYNEAHPGGRHSDLLKERLEHKH